jgi:hypothetical protein
VRATDREGDALATRGVPIATHQNNKLMRTSADVLRTLVTGVGGRDSANSAEFCAEETFVTHLLCNAEKALDSALSLQFSWFSACCTISLKDPERPWKIPKTCPRHPRSITQPPGLPDSSHFLRRERSTHLAKPSFPGSCSMRSVQATKIPALRGF